jgi:hypothetical protein
LIEECNPFLAAYADRRLDFTTKRNDSWDLFSKKVPIVNLENDDGKVIDSGTYDIHEEQNTIEIRLKSGLTTYSVHVYGPGHCALLSGTLSDANINASYFGSEPQDTDSQNDDDHDDY